MRILLADDHDLVRETIAAFLSQSGGAEVVHAGSLDEAVAKYDNTQPFALILLDYDMPGMNGLLGLNRMKKMAEGVPVAVLSGTATADIANAALEAGAAGYLPKTLSSSSLVAAVNVMIAGEIFAPYALLTARRDSTDGDLTDRERDILRGLSQGYSNKEIARDHGLQEVTVKLHVKTLLRKLGAKNRTQAAMIGRDRSLV